MDRLIKNIDGCEYRFSLMGAEQSTELLVEIAGSVGEPISLMGGMFLGSGKLLEKEIKPEFLGMAVKSFFANSEKKKVTRILKEFIGDNALTCDGKKINFNVHYQGRHGHMFKVFYAALEAQYGNFLDAIRELLAYLRPASTQESPL